jgi:hypothetical protein
MTSRTAHHWKSLNLIRNGKFAHCWMILSLKTVTLQKSLTYKEKANIFLLVIKEGVKELSTSKNSLHKISQPATKKAWKKYLKGHVMQCYVKVVG